ncbi:MAG: DUF2085 domain-containing protein [Polyangiaceae bacterium]
MQRDRAEPRGFQGKAPKRRAGKAFGLPGSAVAVGIAFTALALLPWLTVLLRRIPLMHRSSLVLERLYGLQCHQRLGRSFVIWGEHLPVCARCTGVYLGLGLAVWIGRPRLRLDALKAWMLASALLLVADVASELVGLRPANALFRAFTGVLLAYGIGLVVWQWATRSAGTRAR